jgi:hypothetical protein
MTPEEKAQFDKIGRTNVLALFKQPGLQESTRQAAYEWVAEDDRNNARRSSDAARDARWAMYAAWAAAIAAIIAATAAIVK